MPFNPEGGGTGAAWVNTYVAQGNPVAAMEAARKYCDRELTQGEIEEALKNAIVLGEEYSAKEAAKMLRSDGAPNGRTLTEQEQWDCRQNYAMR